jgi:hypothetical protein
MTRWLLAVTLLVPACDLPEIEPLPRHHFAFAVFGDGPYGSVEVPRYRVVLDDVGRADVEWLLHVGDILWKPCSDELYAERLAGLNALPHAVIYTPGDNEWTDCHERAAGGFPPLDRLRSLRSHFFAQPGRSLGRSALPLESQAKDSVFAEFVENVRWRKGGFLFITLHLVGSANGTAPFRTRTAENDAEVTRRTQAALVWLDEAFRIARAERLHGVVIALHANPFARAGGARPGFEAFFARLQQLVMDYPGQVLLVHGDSHTQRVDHPLPSRASGAPLENFTRLETYGSPDIGWVRVVVDSVRGRFTTFEPRLVPPWIVW